MRDIPKLITEVEALVQTADKLSLDAASSAYNLGPERIQELSSVAVRGGQVIQKLYGATSQYAQSWKEVLGTTAFTSMHKTYCDHISQVAGILKGIQHDLKTGMLADFKRLLQGEIFADFLEMAEHLLEGGYKDAAAVLLGAVLEDSLRKVATVADVSVVGPNGKPLTIDPLNVAVAKAGSYGGLVQKQITTWANLRNDAAHGHFAKYDADQVRQMLLFVQKFCADYLQ